MLHFCFQGIFIFVCLERLSVFLFYNLQKASRTNSTMSFKLEVMPAVPSRPTNYESRGDEQQIDTGGIFVSGLTNYYLPIGAFRGYPLCDGGNLAQQLLVQPKRRP